MNKEVGGVFFRVSSLQLYDPQILSDALGQMAHTLIHKKKNLKRKA